jgi:hypothetical protein
MMPLTSLMLLISATVGQTPVMVQDFETGSFAPTVWVVNIPNENASVKLSTDHPQGGTHCLGLHYQFVGEGGFQYLGVPVKTKIQSPVHKLRYWIRGNGSKCSYGVQITDIRGETHQYRHNTGQSSLIDFDGWKEVVIDLDAGHETWGGDKNGKIDYPITAITFTVGQPSVDGKTQASEGNLAIDSIAVDSDGTLAETLGSRISVTSPSYGSDIKGNVIVDFKAPGFKEITARCWKASGKFGSDSVVATVTLDPKGQGQFTFPSDLYPHGPITLRLSGTYGKFKDTCYLQLYNQGGIAWNEGIPKEPPPAAKGLTLAFADDFKGPLSISSTDPKALYYDHKPPNGYQDFSQHTFTGRESPKNPFAQMDTYLRIRASDKTNASGLISSMKNDASGLKVSLPCYFECRFVGPNAVGAWPGFWLMTDYMTDYKLKGDKTPVDEIDIIEAYGGEGPGSPNADDSYMITPHCWNQGEAGLKIEKKAFEGMHNPVHMRKYGIPSTWFETFHTYGCKITETETIYYCDDIELGRHETLPICKEKPLFFMVSLATGGGWPVDLSRYNGQADLYVDFIRVYGKAR